jgi:hypothetical protein
LPEATLDRALAMAPPPACMLDLASAPSQGAVARWLASKPASRWIGSMYSDAHADKYLFRLDPRRAFDALAFVATTTAARANPSGRRPADASPPVASAVANLELSGAGPIPDGWNAGGIRTAHAHTIAISHVRSPSGGRTVCIARDHAPWRWGEGRLMQTFLAAPWHGATVRLEAAIRAETSKSGSGAQVFIACHREPDGEPAWMMRPELMALLERRVRSRHWARHAVELVVPATAHSITIGLVAAGTGAAWFGDLELSFG